MSNTYSVVITGKLVDGYDLELVQESFASLFKLSQERVQSYFLGKPKVLKKAVDHETATKYKTRIEKLGALVELKPASIANESSGCEVSQTISIEKNKKLVNKLDDSASIQGQGTLESAVAPRMASKRKSKKLAKKRAGHIDPSINAIEAGRQEKIRRMQQVKLAPTVNNPWLMKLGLASIIFAIVDAGLTNLNIFSLSGTLWAPVVFVLVGAVLIKSSRAS